MGVSTVARLYALTALVFFAIDLLWLGIVARGFYQEHLGHLLRAKTSWPPALLFYALYIAGILVFAVLPGLGAGSWVRTLALGAFLGLVAYATFDLTSLALIRDFPVRVVVVDLIWGSVLTGTVATAAHFIGRWLGTDAA
ncbi:MAG: DUF2177 family protein [Myxococcales bacterium]|jgi:uncharacterized membrane protein